MSTEGNSSDKQIDCALDLMRRLPPQDVERNLGKLVDLCPHITEDLLSSIDQPLKVRVCPVTQREYLLCDYNRDGDSFRSPWSNAYNPPLEDGALPSDSLRKLEVIANDAFATYREMYFDGGISSVYMWDLEEGFASVVLLKKVVDASKKMKGVWDSIHVLECVPSSSGVTTSTGTNAALPPNSKLYNYKLTSTIMLHLITEGEAGGMMTLAGNLTRQSVQDCPVSKSDPTDHVANIGRLIEEMENKMRNTLQEIYFGKTQDIVRELRAIQGLANATLQADLARELMAKMQDRK